MNRRTLAIFASLLSLLSTLIIFVVWNNGTFVGIPTEAISAGGSEIRFPIDEGDVIRAVTNALGLYRYRGMMLDEATGNDDLAPNWHPTNGFVLIPEKSI